MLGDDFRDVEVAYLINSAIDKDVGAFEVPMQHSIVMQQCQSFEDVICHLPDFCFFDGRLAVFVRGDFLEEVSLI